MAELQVSAGASWVLLGALGAADVLNLVVERFECGVDLSIVLTEVSGSLVGPHVPERIRGLFMLTKTSEGGHVNARARGTRRTGGSGVSGGTLRGKEERWKGYIWHHTTIHISMKYSNFLSSHHSACVVLFIAQKWGIILSSSSQVRPNKTLLISHDAAENAAICSAICSLV